MNWLSEFPSLLLITTITAFVIWTTQKSSGFFAKLYQWLPPVLLLYLLPTLATNTGLVKPGSTIRVLSMNTVLPLSLIMLTAIIHVPDLLRVTRKGLAVFFIGTVGIVLGGPLALAIVGLIEPSLLVQAGAEAPWRGLVCITGGWINGTPGQLSMKEVYGSSEPLFLTALATDIVLQNAWLILLLYSVKIQKPLNRWLTKNSAVDYDMVDNEELQKEMAEKISIPGWRQWLLLTISFALVLFFSNLCAQFFAQRIGNDESNTWSFLGKKSLWLILFATSWGLALSFTNYFKKSLRFWTLLGNAMLFFVIASIGLQLDLKEVSINGYFFAIGIVWLIIHLLLLLLGSRLLRTPWHYAAIGSQANIGGPASASVVAGSFHPSLVSLGILMGVLSNVIGNYANLIAGFIFQWVTQ